jgi:predicted DNA-binding transcriptional regulator AlpA
VNSVGTSPLPPLVSTRQLAAHLGVHPSTVYRWRQLGRAPRAITLASGQLRWRWADVAEWLSGRDGAA